MRAIWTFSACQRAFIDWPDSRSSESSASTPPRRSRAPRSSSRASACFSISSWMILRSTSSISWGRESISMRSRLPASSIRSMALSGRNRPPTYRSDNLAAAISESSVMRTPW